MGRRHGWSSWAGADALPVLHGTLEPTLSDSNSFFHVHTWPWFQCEQTDRELRSAASRSPHLGSLPWHDVGFDIKTMVHYGR